MLKTTTHEDLPFCLPLARHLLLLTLSFIGVAQVAWSQNAPAESAGIQLRAVDEFELPARAWEVVEPDEIRHALRQAGHHPPDELDRPRFTRRQNHRGYEVRTFHFVVTSTHSEAQAEALAAELERAWRDVGKLADAFTANHRQPTFGLSAVGVLVTDQPFSDRGLPQGPNAANAESDIYLYAPQGELTAEHVVDLRRQSVRSMLRVAQLDQTLPRWAQEGLTEVAARQTTVSLPAADGQTAQANENQVSRRPVLPQLATAPQTWLTRGAADQLPAPVDNSVAAEAMAYLLLADDAQHAPETLKALAEIVQNQPASGPAIARARQATYAATYAEHTAALRQAAFVPEAITGQDDFGERLAHWAQDPWRDVPELVVTDKADAQLVSHGAELLVLLKLARRFGTAPQAAVGPQITEWRDVVARRLEEQAAADDPAREDNAAEPVERTPAVAQRPMLNAAHLVAKLSEPNAEPWATLDAEGRLLLWYDEPRVANLVAGDVRQLANGERDGKTTLQATLRDGRVAEASWREPAEVGQRPQVHVRWK